jgi:hypothetical protein
MAQQTAVEWLFIELYEIFEMKGDGKLMADILKQAEQMEKEQIMNAYNAGESDGDHYEDSSLIYYIDTFKIK